MKRLAGLIAILLLSANCFAQGHFIVAFTGNGQDHMNIYVITATINGVDMEANDEIAAFDGTICCGKTILTQSINYFNSDTYAAIAPSRKDDGELNGYTIGHAISFKIWDSNTSRELSGITVEFIDPFTGQKITPPLYTPGQTAFVKLSVTVPENKTPISGAGNDQSINEGENVTLDGTASSDPDGDPLTYLWNAPVGITLSSTTVARPTFTAPEVTVDTNYTFSLTVNDGIESSVADDVVITVKQVNKAPVANAGTNLLTTEGFTVTLDGTGSSDPDGDPVTFFWTAPAGITISSTTAAKPTFTAPDVNVNSNFSFSLLVNDGNLNSITDEVVITVKPVNTIPFANAGIDFAIIEGDTLTLDGTASSDPDGDQLTYFWTAPEGITLSSTTVAKPTFMAPEVTADTDYTFYLIVNDGTESSIADEVVIKIKQVNKAPVADAGADQTLDENSICTLYGLNSFDPDENTLSYSWTAPAGIMLNSNTIANPVFNVPEVSKDTVLIFSLIVSDGLAYSDPSVIRVSVVNVIKTGAEIAAFDGIKVCPNPSNGIFIIDGLNSNQKNKIEIHTVNGKLINQLNSNSNIENIDISSQFPGTYLLLINKKPFKIIKQNIP
jgi:hypothetical protein